MDSTAGYFQDGTPDLSSTTNITSTEPFINLTSTLAAILVAVINDEPQEAVMDEGTFLGVRYSAWITMMIVLAAVTLVGLIMCLLFCCCCSSGESSPRRRRPVQPPVDVNRPIIPG